MSHEQGGQPDAPGQTVPGHPEVEYGKPAKPGPDHSPVPPDPPKPPKPPLPPRNPK